MNVLTKHSVIFISVSKSRQGIVFIPVCDSVHRGGSLSKEVLCPERSLSRGVSPVSSPYGNVGVVHILLECILVIFNFTVQLNGKGKQVKLIFRVEI